MSRVLGIDPDADQLVEAALSSGRYSVNESGEIRLLKTNKGKPRLLRPRTKSSGYQHINLYHDGHELTVGVHRVVAIWFCGAEAVAGKHIAHLNHDKTDNRKINLKPMTPQEHCDYDRDRRRATPPRTSWPPCADCGTPDGYTGGRPTPKRADGSKFGFSGSLCSTCWHRHYHHYRKAQGYIKKRRAA